MKYLFFLSATILFSSSSASAIEPNIEIIEQFDNMRTVAFVSIKDIEDSPVWYPGASGDSTPPIGVDDAIHAVSAFAGLRDANTVKEIEIRPVPDYEDRWHYLVKVTNDSSVSKFDIYVVLMSGKVLPAIIEPQAYK